MFSTLMYDSETWTIETAEINKIAAFETWCHCRMLRISWVDRVCNVQLKRMNKNEDIISTIKKKKLEYFGHRVIRPNYALLQNIMEGRIKGRRNQGRRERNQDLFGVTSNQLFRATANKIKITSEA